MPNRAKRNVLLIVFSVIAVAPAHATLAPSYTWQTQAHKAGGGMWYSPWLPSGEAACAALLAQISASDASMSAYMGYSPGFYVYRNITATPGYYNTWPSYKCTIGYEYRAVSGSTWYSMSGAIEPVGGPTSNSRWAYLTALPQSKAQCDRCNAQSDPISPASGSVIEVETDLARTATGLSFQRTYSSVPLTDAAPGLNLGWRYSFSRSIKKVYASTLFKQWTSDPLNSSKYTSEEAACTSGFAEIKSHVAQWASASASYSGGACSVSIGSTVIATLPILYTDGIPTPNPTTLTLVGYEATRDDGRVVNFTVAAGSIVAPPTIALKLQTSGSGLALTDENDAVEYYDSSGNLQTVTRRPGVVETVVHDSLGRLSSVTDSFGQSFTLAYSSTTGLLSTLTDPASHTVQYAYDSSARLSTVTQTDGTARTYHYEDTNAALLTGITDENSQRIATWGYDSSGRATSATGAGGADALTVVYNSDGSVTTTDALGAARTFTFGRFGERNLVTGISGAQCPTCQEPKATTYDSRGFASSRTDYNGNVTCYAYDDNRGLELVRVEGFAPSSTCPSNLASYTPASGTRQRKIATTWDATYRLPSQIVEANRTTAFTFDTHGNVLTKIVTDTSVTPNVSRTWTYTYNGYGQVLTADGPRSDVSDVTTLAYYGCSTGGQCGQVQTITNALSQVTTFNTYNAYGEPLTITDPNSVVTTLGYDLRRRLVSRAASSETTSFDYWPTGLLKQVTLPDASTVQYTYDNAHRLTGVADGAGNSIAYTLDALGNRTAENVYDASSVLHRTHTRVFNSLSRLYQDVNAAGTAAVTTTFGYDSDGNPTSINAPLSRNTVNVYDELDRLRQITDPGSGVTQIAYDADDHVAQVTDPRSLVTTYAYSGFGERVSQVSPDTGTTTSVYDAGGNLATATDARGAVATYAYDALNRVMSVAYSNGGVADQTITYSYDTGTNGAGRLTGGSDANHSMNWSYDALGRVTGKSQTVGAVTLSVAYSYTNGDLTGITTPSGQSVVYGYDSNHRVTSVAVNGTTVLSGVTYEPLGPVSGWTWGNSTTTSRTYDTDGKITGLASAAAKGYSYDDAFRITGISDTGTPVNSYTYGYDSLDRLSSAAKTGTTRGWTYDANGNRLSETGASPSTYSIASSSNRVSSISGALARTYAYDASGDTLTYASVTATYSNRGRLQTLTNGAVTATYVYNALGERVKQSGGASGTVHYVYDEAGHLLGEYDSSGALLQETIWLDDTPVATLRPGTPVGLFYVHTDHLNTPRRITQPSDNALRWSWESDPFGAEVPNENPASLGAFQYNLRFPGQLYDSQAGLSYNYFRDYDPAIGRYVESDPIGLAGGLNTFAYAYDNPLGYVDPYGLWCFDFDKFANEIREDRLSSVLDRFVGGGDALTATNLTLTALNTPFRYPRAGLGTAAGSATSILSTLGMRYPVRLPVRLLNTTNALRALGRLGVLTTIVEGFYDIGVEVKAAVHATSSNDCDCGG